MDQSLTIIYYTGNYLKPELEKIAQYYLLRAVEKKKIISVSQKPIDFGDNICVGNIGKSHHSLFYQALKGAEATDTEYIALAEDDCLYTSEHFNYMPPTDDIFYYNTNCWFVQWSGSKIDGMYSYHRRKAMSQLICNREIFIKAVKEKINMIETGFEIRKGQPGACEPGVCDDRKAFIKAKEKWEWAKFKDVGKEDKWTALGFRTLNPNLDIRHGNNFSGARRANDRCYSLPYWGEFKKVIEEYYV